MDRDHYNVLSNRFNCYEQSNQPDNALRDLERLVQLSPGDKYWLEKLVSYYKFKEPSEALESFQALYSICNNNEILFNIARLQWQLGQIDSAILSFKEGLKEDPDNKQAVYDIAVLLHNQENYDESYQYYTQA